MKTCANHQRPAGVSPGTPTLPQLVEKIRRLADAACAARGGAERMGLGDWYAVEEELKRKVEYEHQKHQDKNEKQTD